MRVNFAVLRIDCERHQSLPWNSSQYTEQLYVKRLEGRGTSIVPTRTYPIHRITVYFNKFGLDPCPSCIKQLVKELVKGGRGGRGIASCSPPVPYADVVSECALKVALRRRRSARVFREILLRGLVRAMGPTNSHLRVRDHLPLGR